MRLIGIFTLSLSALSLGCQPSKVEIGDGTTTEDPVDTSSGEQPGDTADTGTPEEEEQVDPVWDTATLVILSPASGDFLPWGESADFEAEVRAEDGSVLDFDEITWASDADSAWGPTGASFSDDSLDVGLHNLTAEARLPNGDRLASSVGGVRVQAEDAGTYVGNVIVDIGIEYSGTTYTLSCIGSTTIIVDVYGEAATGASSCVVSLNGYDLDANQDFDLVVDSGDVEGEANLDLTLFTYGFDVSGDIGDGELSATWSDDVYGYAAVEGELTATRVSRDTTGE